MPDPKPWEKYANVAPVQSGPPAVIYGDPKAPDPITPYQQQEIGFQNRSSDRADAASIRADAAATRSAAAAERTATAAEANANKLNEGQGKAAGFYARAKRAETDWGGLLADPQAAPATQAPGVMGDAVRAVFPANVVNANTSGARQRAQQAKEDFIAASLRLESGASIGKEEFDRQDRIFYPQTGDGPDVIAQKERARQTVIDGFRIQSGGGADQVDAMHPAIAPAMSQADAEAQVGKMLMAGTSGKDIAAFLEKSGRPLNPEQRKNLEANVGNQAPDVRTGGAAEVGHQIGLGVGDLVQAAGDTLGLVGNPLNAAINATGLPEAIGSAPLSTDIGSSLRTGFGLPTPQNDAERAFSAVGRSGASALTGAGVARGVTSALAGFAGGGGSGGGMSLARYVADKVGASPALDTLAGATSGGAGEVARQNGFGPAGQIVASALGGLGGLGGAAAIRRVTGERVPNALLQAARNQSVDLLPADAGGATTRRLTGAAAQGPLSAAPIVARAQAGQRQMGEAVARTAGQAGETLPPDEAGNAIRRAGELYSAQSSARGGKLYDRAHRLAGDTKLKPTGAVQAIDAELARLNETPEVNKPLIDELTKFKDSLSRGDGLSVQGLRDVRTIAGKASYTEALRSTPAKAVLGRVADAISGDISAGLTQAGKGNAARAFKTADAYWKDRVEQIDQVLEPVIGKGRSGEDVLGAIESMARGQKGGVSRLGRLMRLAPETERGDLQATVIDRLGRATPGQQGAEGNAFSSATFLTNWNKMSSKGKAELFPASDIRNNLNDIATLADNMKQAQRYANHSNTGGGIVGQVMLSGGIGALGGLKGLILATVSQYLSGRALASPRLVNWLAKVPVNPPPSYIGRLSVIASREPAIASEVQNIQQRIMQVANENAPQMGSVAASPNEGPDKQKSR